MPSIDSPAHCCGVYPRIDMPTLEPTTETGRIYEFCVLYPYPLSQKEEKNAQKSVEDLFAEAGGKQVAKDVWSRRGLAYKIGGYDEGIYVVYHYEIDPEKLKELDNALRITKNVLRHIVVKPPKNYQIVEYSKEYEKWLKNKETEVDKKAQEKEDQLKQKMLEKQKRQAARAEKKEKVSVSAKTAPDKEKKEDLAKDEAELTAEIDKLIADDELEL